MILSIHALNFHLTRERDHVLISSKHLNPKPHLSKCLMYLCSMTWAKMVRIHIFWWNEPSVISEPPSLLQMVLSQEPWCEGSQIRAASKTQVMFSSPRTPVKGEGAFPLLGNTECHIRDALVLQYFTTVYTFWLLANSMFGRQISCPINNVTTSTISAFSPFFNLFLRLFFLWL